MDKLAKKKVKVIVKAKPKSKVAPMDISMMMGEPMDYSKMPKKEAKSKAKVKVKKKC